MNRPARTRQSGAVLILTLWTIVLLSMLVLVMAAEARFSAELSRSQIGRTGNRVDTLTALNAAEMELLLETMPEPAADTDPEDDDDVRNPDFRFNGQALELAYAHPETVEVRIYDHAGKINLRNLTEDRLRLMLEHLMEAAEGEVDDDEITELLAAWGDWIDEDDGIRVEGAEEEYYLSLEQPYLPRQGQLESVEELLLIRGFDKWFGDVNLGAAFTLHTDSDLVNLNTASREALALIPGLDAEAIDAIVAYRQEQDFTDFLELEDIVSDDGMAEFQPWVDFAGVSPFYTVLVVPGELTRPGAAEGETEAGSEAGTEAGSRQEAWRQPRFGGLSKVVRVDDSSQRPFVLRVDPVARLPILD